MEELRKSETLVAAGVTRLQLPAHTVVAEHLGVRRVAGQKIATFEFALSRPNQVASDHLHGLPFVAKAGA